MDNHSSFSLGSIASHVLLRAAVASLVLLGVACNKQPEPAPEDLAAVASLNSCQQRIVKWQQLQAAVVVSNVGERITQLRNAAVQIGEDPEGCTTSLINDAISNELRKVVVLKVGPAEFAAGVVYSCSELSEGTKCAGRSADDTAQLGEAPDGAAILPAAGDAQVTTSTEYAVTSLQWYQALDQALLASSTAAVRVTPKPDGSLRLPVASEANIVFAIGKGASGELHKWVWLVR